MMRLVYFEIRKNYLRKHVLAAFFLLLLLNMFMIYSNYLSGDRDPIGYFMPRSASTQNLWAFYESMHEKLDGALTAEKVRFVVEENNRLNALIADGTYSREYQPDTYTGYIWGDYAMINKYFYQPMEYAAGYESNIKQVVEKATENIAFYERHGNSYEKEKNEFIRDHYSGRKITLFYDGKPWELLLTYDFSDLLILLLLLLGIVPIFVNEKETKMDGLILSSRNGKVNMAPAKVISVFLYVAFLLIIFSSVNFLLFRLLYGLPGTAMPLYALEAYQYTPLNYSVGTFYVLTVFFKLGGFFVFGLWLCIFSALCRRVLYPYMLGVLTIAGGLYLSGYLAAVDVGRAVWALISPFTLIKANELFAELLGINLHGMFFLRASVGILVQVAILIILYLLIRLFSSTKILQRKKVFFVRKVIKCCLPKGKKY